MQLDQQAVTYLLGLAAIIHIIFKIYETFRNPQIKLDLKSVNAENRILDIEKSIIEIKETHIRMVEKDMKDLTIAVNELGKTVIKLSTIIDERIPKGTPSLTPPGV